jgi:phosphoserine phosphatase RsbU/P
MSGRDTIPVSARDADLSLLVHAASEEVRLAYPDAIIACSGGEDVRGKWDPDLVQQVVGNLLSNAAKYGTRGEEVTVRCHVDGDDALLEVRNKGHTIPPERIPHLFDGVSQFAEEHSRQGGIGLGLFICREIVRAHGGAITAVSNDVDGTTFRVRLPKDGSAAA